MGRASRKKHEKIREATHECGVLLAVSETQSIFSRTLVALFLITLLTVFVYSNTLSVPFHFDDYINIVDNPFVKYLGNFLDLSNTRYVGFLTLAINYAVGGLDVFGYHLVNLSIHVVNGLLVYALVGLIFSAANRRNDEAQVASYAYHVALLTALLFIAHPLQTQSVTYIVQRFASLVTTFYLLTIVCYLKWRINSDKTKGSSLGYIASLASCIVAMKTKENSFTIPFMVIMVEGIFGDTNCPTKKRWSFIIPFLLTLMIIPFSRAEVVGEYESITSDQTPISRWEYLFTQFRVIVTYLRLLVLPINQHIDYDYPVYRSFFKPPVLFSFIFLASIIGFAVYAIRKTPLLRIIGFGIIWFFLTLSVESSIIPIKDVIFEHRIYLPSIGFFLVIGCMAAFALTRWKGMKVPILVTAFVVIGALSIATYQRNRVWQDRLTLGKDNLRKAPNKVRVQSMLGNVYEDIGQIDDAIAAYKSALKLKPNSPESAMPANDLANIYVTQGKYDDAIKLYEEVVKVVPNYGWTYNNLGQTYYRQGRLDEAVESYKKALSIDGDLDRTHFNLGEAYAKAGRVNEAIDAYKKAIHLRPESADYYYFLGNAYASQKQLDEAAKAYKAALQLKPNFAGAYNNLGNIAMLKGRYEDAIHAYEKALRLSPDLVQAKGNLDIAVERLEQTEKP